MTKSIPKRNIIYTALAAIAVFALMTSPSETNDQSHVAHAVTSQAIPGPFIPSTPEFSKAQMNAFMTNAMIVPEIKNWSDKWQFGWVDFTGTTIPTSKWTHMQLHLILPPNAPALKACDIGWESVVDIDLSTGKIDASSAPNMATECHRGFNMQDPASIQQTVESNPLLPSAAATATSNGYSVATMDDINNINNSIQGSIADILTPSFSGSYSHLNGFVAQLVNLRFSPNAGQNYLQSGWIIAGPNGCTSNCVDAIQANSKVLEYADSSVFGNSHGHVFGYPNQIPAWVNGQTETAEILCNGGSSYKEQEAYGTSLLAHVSNVACGTGAQGSSITNSVYLENANTGSSSNWSGDITSTVKGTNAHELLNGAWNWWQTSRDRDQPCSGSDVASTVMTGNIQLGGTATWSTLSNVPVGC
ncbi:MAG: hypothetical protein KGI02_09530 [Thaumarchaeota archaeon]|nr:hypothetical protein [Nitrososphaerota archaeon]MDE1841451.1 hypothetical protein [Nitrososphaerota archaeon]